VKRNGPPCVPASVAVSDARVRFALSDIRRSARDGRSGPLLG
jgi:hypothetical protein